MNTKIDPISKHFQLPISYNSLKMELSPNIITDLELTSTVDNEKTVDSSQTVENSQTKDNSQTVDNNQTNTTSSMYNIVLSPTTCFGKETLPLFANYYTTDTHFLNDTQELLKTYNQKDTLERSEYEKTDYEKTEDEENYDTIYNAWKEIKGETSFCEKYLYIDWDMGKFLNKNASFLQVMSLYNITSPVISFCLPIIIIILPFFIIKMKGLKLNMTEYTEILKTIISKHAIGKLFTNYSDISLNEQIYLLVSAGLYLFSIYQNVLICVRFYKNMYNINKYLSTIKQYLNHTIQKFDYYLSISEKLTSYSGFNETVKKHRTVLEDYKTNLLKMQEFKLNFSNLLNVGNMLKMFYLIYDDEEYNSSMVFSFGFHGYLDNISGLIKNIQGGNINYATFNKEEAKTKVHFKKMYYPSLMNEKHVKNDCDFNKNIIITGPNASGKTTILKSSLINVILSQQFGCGCYADAKMQPYKYIHCYLNIPDTSGRDSLFQAEARRCKTMIECISNNPKDTHFCAFDELYSGTNPEDAVSSSIAFMNYLIKDPNVTSILTTHYVKVCKKLAKNENIKNYKMKVHENSDGTFDYKYVLESGISKIKGGLKVLTDMNYPTEILNKI